MMSSSKVRIFASALAASRRIRKGLLFSALTLGAGWVAAQDKAGAPPLEPWDKTRFDDRSTMIDNPWLPMKPGMRYVYEGHTVEDSGKRVPHRVEINVTDLTKLIDGVRVLISYYLDFSDGELEEAELAFFAQDREGTVWHLGQYPEEYDNGKMTSAPSWIHGFEGARAGITMKAKPQLGAPSYSQGYGPAVDWTDRGQTHEMGLAVKVRAGTYTDVLAIKETATSEVGASQLKYYARGVGNIKVGWSGADKTKETLELVRVEKLSPKALADVRAKALKLEKSAYANSKTVYALTAPAERLK
jgi:hypothetical protein